jgi:hypothetical protein
MNFGHLIAPFYSVVSKFLKEGFSKDAIRFWGGIQWNWNVEGDVGSA